jgi:hypothetical protein
MAKSSYTDKVYPRLLKTGDGQALKNRILHQLQSLNLDEHTFHVSQGYGTGEGSMQVHTCFYFVGDGVKIKQSFEDDALSSVSTLSIELGRQTFLGKDDEEGGAEAVVHARLGKDKGVPTFNCLKEVILNGKTFSYKSSKDPIISFKTWLWSEQICTSNEFKEARERLCKQIRARRNTQSFLQDRREAQAQFACESIKKLMMKYSWLGDDTMKRAVQTFVIGEILET